MLSIRILRNFTRNLNLGNYKNFHLEDQVQNQVGEFYQTESQNINDRSILSKSLTRKKIKFSRNFFE